MTGRQFEDYVVNKLFESGYWAHRISPNESGQQPFDIIAMKDDIVCIYDAKVISNGYRFPMSRIEDNQINAFNMIASRTNVNHVGLLFYTNEDAKIWYMPLHEIHTAIWLEEKSIDVRECYEWRPL